jgi:DNA-binding NarL/FixJ family response regulator
VSGIESSEGPVEGVITVVLIEDNRLVRDALTILLNRSPDLHVICEEPNGHDRLLKTSNPDVVLLDLGLENGDSLRIAKGVLKQFPKARVVIMDLLPSQDEISVFVNAGVSGFIMKDASVETVEETIRSVASGHKVLPDRMTATLFDEIARESVANGMSHGHESVRITPREREVIDLIAEGMSNKAIAKSLEISVHTVKSHLRNIMEKLTLHSRLQIAVYAHEKDGDAEKLEVR